VRTPGALAPKAKVDANGKAELDAELELPEMSAPSTPASGRAAVYVKTDGKIYLKDDAGTETDLTSGGGGHTIAESTSPTGVQTAFASRSNLVFNSNQFTGEDNSVTDATFISLSTGVSGWGWFEVSSQSVSAQQNVTFSGLDNASRYRLEFENTSVTTSGTYFQIIFNGNTGAVYDVGRHQHDESGSHTAPGLTNQGEWRLTEAKLGSRAIVGFVEFLADDDIDVIYAHALISGQDSTANMTGNFSTCEFAGSADMSSVMVDVNGTNTMTGTVRLLKYGPISAVINNTLPKKTLAELSAYVPGDLGEMFFVKDGTGDKVVVSTGLSAGNFSDMLGGNWD